jgi:uncharacterized protein YjbI with pentapeptide repeats
MSEYNLDLQYNDITYGENEVNFKILNLVHLPIVISQCNFIAVAFIDCQFNSCNFTSSNINHVAKNGLFNKCKMTEVNFAMCDKFILKFILKSVFWISPNFIR